MASLYIKDSYTAELVARLAKDSKMTKTVLFREMTEERKPARKVEHDRGRPSSTAWARLQKFWRDHPLGEPTGLEADRAFYDSLNDEEDD